MYKTNLLKTEIMKPVFDHIFQIRLKATRFSWSRPPSFCCILTSTFKNSRDTWNRLAAKECALKKRCKKILKHVPAYFQKNKVQKTNASSCKNFCFAIFLQFTSFCSSSFRSWPYCSQIVDSSIDICRRQIQSITRDESRRLKLIIITD